jgi:hypothetical protein
MNWLRKLIQYFQGKPVILKSGKTVVNKATDIAAAQSMKSYLKILQSQQGQTYIKSLSVTNRNLLKNQIVKQKITPDQLRAKIFNKRLVKPIKSSTQLVKDPLFTRLMFAKLKFMQGKDLAKLFDKLRGVHGAKFGDFTLKLSPGFQTVRNEINIIIMQSTNKVGQFNAFIYTDPVTKKLSLQIMKVEIYTQYKGQGIMRDFYRSFNQYLKTNFDNFDKFTSDFIFQYNKQTGKYDGFNMWEDLVSKGLAKRTGPIENYIPPKIAPKNGLWHIKSGYQLIERVVR